MGWDAFGHAGLLLVSKRAGLGCPSGRTHMGHHPQNPSLLTHGVFRGCIPTHNHIGIHPMVSTIVPFFCVVPASGHSVSPITKRSVGNGEFLGTECNSAFQVKLKGLFVTLIHKASSFTRSTGTPVHRCMHAHLWDRHWCGCTSSREVARGSGQGLVAFDGGRWKASGGRGVWVRGFHVPSSHSETMEGSGPGERGG